MAVRQAQYKVAKKRREGNQKIRKRARKSKYVEIRLQKQFEKFSPVEVLLLFTQNWFTCLYKQSLQNFQQQVIATPDHNRKQLVIVLLCTQRVASQMLADGCCSFWGDFTATRYPVTERRRNVLIPTYMKAAFGSADVLHVTCTSKFVDNSTRVVFRGRILRQSSRQRSGFIHDPQFHRVIRFLYRRF